MKSGFLHRIPGLSFLLAASLGQRAVQESTTEKLPQQPERLTARRSGKSRRRQFTPGAFGHQRAAAAKRAADHDPSRRHNEARRETALRALSN